MPWKEQRTMSLKIEFVERASLPGANVSALCREFGISRDAGHKWLKRFRAEGYEALEERSRRPDSTPLASAEDVVALILQTRQKHPTWGPRKLLGPLKKKLGGETPSEKTIARILKRFGEIRAKRRRRPLNIVERAPMVTAKACNDVWTIDFKGWWLARNGDRCEPLTVRDAYSRYVLAIELIPTRVEDVRVVMERLFKRYGVPDAIKCDNGSPFINAQGRGGLSRLSAWWVSLGIELVRSRRAKPQDNGAHERMHRDMVAEIEMLPAASRAEQQRDCARWRQTFNHVRPHDALNGKTPAEVFKPVRRPPKRSFVYPSHMLVRRVDVRGYLHIGGATTFVGNALTGQEIGLKPLGGLRFRGWFRQIDLDVIELQPTTRLLRSCDEQVA